MACDERIKNLSNENPSLFSYEYARKRLEESPLRALKEILNVPTESQKEAQDAL